MFARVSRRFVSTSSWYNIPPSVSAKLGVNVHQNPYHPIGIIKKKIEQYFHASCPGVFHCLDGLDPRVSTKASFDDLLIPSDHVIRSPRDTYYVDEFTVLRPHTSAHQTELLRRGYDAFLCSGDVYRRDEIDASHYPVFHQMEGVRIFTREQLGLQSDTPYDLFREAIVADLKKTLEGVARLLFGDVEMKWVDAYFPFTDPSLELEILYQGRWMEVLGCGAVHPTILNHCGRGSAQGWAFGLGLDRLAMILFQIPDIRLFWSQDERFVSQFSSGEIVTFTPFSKYPPCYKDVTFWIEDERLFNVNDLMELLREEAGDVVEEVKISDEFRHPKTSKLSHCYRIIYRSMERSLTNEEVNEIQFRFRDRLSKELPVTLR